MDDPGYLRGKFYLTSAEAFNLVFWLIYMVLVIYIRFNFQQDFNFIMLQEHQASIRKASQKQFITAKHKGYMQGARIKQATT